VVGAAWNKQKGGYDVQVKDLESDTIVNDHCDILVNASGILNNWQWPAIPGLDKYKGKLLHTANWDDDVDLTGRHVGLIGNGSVNNLLHYLLHSNIAAAPPVSKSSLQSNHTSRK